MNKLSKLASTRQLIIQLEKVIIYHTQLKRKRREEWPTVETQTPLLRIKLWAEKLIQNSILLAEFASTKL